MAPWTRPLEVDRLAAGGVDVEFIVPLAELSLRSAGAGVSGTVSGHARFSREQGIAVAELSVSGSATLECQRCLKPVVLPLETVTRVALISSEAQAARLPRDLEPVLVAAGRISIGELVTEELLLALPLVPRHHGECPSGPAEGVEAQHDGETHRPFAHLAELLKR